MFFPYASNVLLLNMHFVFPSINCCSRLPRGFASSIRLLLYCITCNLTIYIYIYSYVISLYYTSFPQGEMRLIILFVQSTVESSHGLWLPRVSLTTPTIVINRLQRHGHQSLARRRLTNRLRLECIHVKIHIYIYPCMASDMAPLPLGDLLYNRRWLLVDI